VADGRQAEGHSPEVAALLRRRAERLRTQPDAADDDERSLLWVAEFSVGDEQYAMPLRVLRAAIPLRLVTAVPLAPPHVLGVCRFEGQLVAALSLASLLGGRTWGFDPKTLLVLDPRGDGRLTAVDCEQVPKPICIPLRAVEEARARTRDPIIAPITMPDLQLLHLVDVARLLDSRAPESVGAD
jgi:purine-binding chemotaxis protein CheW